MLTNWRHPHTRHTTPRINASEARTCCISILSLLLELNLLAQNSKKKVSSGRERGGEGGRTSTSWWLLYGSERVSCKTTCMNVKKKYLMKMKTCAAVDRLSINTWQMFTFLLPKLLLHSLFPGKPRVSRIRVRHRLIILSATKLLPVWCSSEIFFHLIFVCVCFYFVKIHKLSNNQKKPQLSAHTRPHPDCSMIIMWVLIYMRDVRQLVAAELYKIGQFFNGNYIICGETHLYIVLCIYS